MRLADMQLQDLRDPGLRTRRDAGEAHRRVRLAPVHGRSGRGVKVMAGGLADRPAASASASASVLRDQPVS